MKVGLSRAKSPDKFDFVLVTYLVLMIGMSLLSIYSAFGIIGQSAGIDYMMKQAMWFIIGSIAIGVIMYLGNDSMLQFAKIGYWFLMACLVVLLIGKVYNMFTGGSLLGMIITTNGATS